MNAVKTRVFHGTEVNLVEACLSDPNCGNMVYDVIPHVALDTVRSVLL